MLTPFTMDAPQVVTVHLSVVHTACPLDFVTAALSSLLHLNHSLSHDNVLGIVCADL